jgi:hypothetical protein
VSGSTGRVLVADSVKGAILAFSPSGEYEETLSGKSSPNGPFSRKGEEPGNVAAVAVEEGTGNVYVAEAERRVVSQYSAGGEWEGWIANTPAGDLGEPRGVALGPEGDVYVADTGLAVVDRFGLGATVPSVTTEKVKKAGLTRTSAELLGTINGEGKPASYRFQYGETKALGSETQSQPSGTGAQAVSATVDHLEVGHGYYYRIVGENEDGSNHGLIERFETLPAVAGLETGSATSVEPEAATLTGSLKREGFVTQYYFQYGTSTAYGKQAPEPAGGVPPATEEKEEKKPKAVATGVSGLAPDTLYHYRLAAENEYGTTYGEDATFTTPGPPRICSEPEPTTAIGQHEATIRACVNPERRATTYHFEYGETTAYGTEVPLGGQTIGSGSFPVAVSAALSGLKAGTTYHYRVLATNEAGTTEGPDQTFMTVAPAPVNATYATNVTATEATLHAKINPLGNDTRYYFQYGAQSCQENPGECTSTPAPPGEDIGAGEVDIAREVKLTNLTPATTYHYRALDSNALGATEGPERMFTTQPGSASFALPDNRAWEMVSPVNKEGAPVEALTHEGGLILASRDGSALTYVVNGALGEEVEGNRSPEWQQIVATRTSSGWASQDIATPNSREKAAEPGNPPEYEFFTPDLGVAFVEPAGARAEPPLAPGVTQATIYLRDNATGNYVPLVTDANTAPGTEYGGGNISFVNATPDLSHVLIRSSVALTGGRSRPGLYEWSGGKLQFVSVLPGGAPARRGPVELGYFHAAANALSSDGSRAIWTVVEAEDNSHRGHLYMRDTARGETLQLDAAQGVAEPSEGWARFQTASSDASRVFFTDRQRLTADSTAEPTAVGQGPGKPDLYECRVVEEQSGKLACRLEDLTVDHNAGEPADVQGFLLGASPDGTSVYLVARGVLAGNEGGNGETAVAGKNNLYALRYDGAHWSTTFIATLSGEDSPEWEGNGNGNASFLTVRVSPNGRYLAFMSAASLTGYDNFDANPAAVGARDEEVYLYDSAAAPGAARLRCVSCNPGGARPNGVLDTRESGEGLGLLADRRGVWAGRWLAGNIPGWTAQSLVSALYQSRYLSDEGRLYFNSPDSLVPAAKNAKEDVYEYEPSGVGSCVSATGGCVSLISGGSSDRESAFIEATPDGSNVFFVTEARLLPSQDTDTAFDIYDARECTAISPCLSPPEQAPAGCNEVDTCRPAEPGQEIPQAAPFTSGFSGPGTTVAPAPSGKLERKASKETKTLTLKQKLKRSLKSCKHKDRHSKHKRIRCEHRAHAHYTHLALAACRHKHPRSKRKACEQAARRRLGVKHNRAKHKGKAAKHGRGGSGR